MWNATPKALPRRDINEHFLGVLRQAVKDCQEFDIRQSHVYAALDALQGDSTKSWGFTVFRRALERPDPELLRQGKMGLYKDWHDTKRIVFLKEWLEYPILQNIKNRGGVFVFYRIKNELLCWAQ